MCLEALIQVSGSRKATLTSVMLSYPKGWHECPRFHCQAVVPVWGYRMTPQNVLGWKVCNYIRTGDVWEGLCSQSLFHPSEVKCLKGLRSQGVSLEIIVLQSIYDYSGNHTGMSSNETEYLSVWFVRQNQWEIVDKWHFLLSYILRLAWDILVLVMEGRCCPPPVG